MHGQLQADWWYNWCSVFVSDRKWWSGNYVGLARPLLRLQLIYSQPMSWSDTLILGKFHVIAIVIGSLGHSKSMWRHTNGQTLEHLIGGCATQQTHGQVRRLPSNMECDGTWYSKQLQLLTLWRSVTCEVTPTTATNTILAMPCGKKCINNDNNNNNNNNNDFDESIYWDNSW